MTIPFHLELKIWCVRSRQLTNRLTNEKGRVAALPLVFDSFGGAEGGRTPDLRIANAALCQTELLPHASKGV